MGASHTIGTNLTSPDWVWTNLRWESAGTVGYSQWPQEFLSVSLFVFWLAGTGPDDDS